MSGYSLKTKTDTVLLLKPLNFCFLVKAVPLSFKLEGRYLTQVGLFYKNLRTDKCTAQLHRNYNYPSNHLCYLQVFLPYPYSRSVKVQWKVFEKLFTDFRDCFNHGDYYDVLACAKNKFQPIPSAWLGY